MTELRLDSSKRSPVVLLPLKLVPPQPRAEVLSRPELQGLLAEVRLQPVTLVTAPAGYGKTTLLTQWASELDRTGATVCWMAPDAGDQDPALLLAYLVRAFQNHFPAIGNQAWRILHSAADLERDWPLVAGALLSDLQSTLSVPTFLFFDDMHLIADGPITSQLLGYLLRTAPPMLHIVIASRRPVSSAPLPRLRAEGLLVDVTQDDLLLTAPEARSLLESNGVTLTSEELDLLLARTEGWVVGVQLAARALIRQAPEQRSHYLSTLDANQQDLFDYLATEVLADLPADLLDFLALAALPEQFNAALLSEVLGQVNAPELLTHAQSMGLPIVALDEGGSALRFHPLLRRLLLRRASTQLDAEATAKLQRLFGRAMEHRGNLEAALKHYATAGATDEMARALREQAWPLVNTPHRDIIRRWLDQLPEQIRRNDPELLHMWGWSMAALAPPQATAAISQAAVLYSEQRLYQRELRALSDLAALLFWEDRPSDFADVCIRAVRAANRVRDAWARGAALVSVVALLYSKERYNAALRVASHAATHPRSPFWQWLLSLIVATISVQQGHPNVAISATDETLAMPQIDRDDRLRQNLLRQRALALYQQGHSSEAVELALTAHRRLSDYYDDGVLGSSAALLAFLLMEQERFEEANTYLARARSTANRTGAGALLARVQVLEIYALLCNGQATQAAAATLDILRQFKTEQRGTKIEGKEPAGSRYLALGSHDLWLRLLLLLALGSSGETTRAAEMADELVNQMEARGDGLFLVIAQLYRAALAQQRGDTATYETALRAGWERAETQGHNYLPVLPSAVLSDAVVAALQRDLAPHIVANVLRRQLPEQATSLLLSLLTNNTTATRARAIALLGDLGATSAYPVLRGLLKDRNQTIRTEAAAALDRLVYRPSYQLRVRTLGAFNVWRGDDEIRDRNWRSVKARQLLQLLLIDHGRMLPRERIMDMLWPGLESEAAANNLRVTISRLTKALEPERPEGAPIHYVVQHGDTFGFNVASDHAVDAVEFADAVAAGRQAERDGQREKAVAAYQRAIKLYGGAFLPDSLYEDWSVVERERLALLFNDAALRLGGLLLEAGQPDEAIGLAWRVLENDQAQEEAYLLLMRAHTALGERSTALRLYNRCVTALRSELGVEPLPETMALYEALRKNDGV
ncbi:MAG: winged helix-turn-helix domain-containing protein [Chloroflexales bacterium]|nr:winged helix-turn-helix domain-containing protein [Chloroflexales bacterium]